MRKLGFLAAVALVSGGVALAGSLNIPFFLDDAPADGQIPPGSLTASYIALHNNTDTPLTCGVSYRKADGTDRTPATFSFTLPANSTWSFRPCWNDAVTEGAGAAVPNMALVAGDYPTGSATVSWVGATNLVQGRLTAIRATASGDGDSYSFTLPPGF